METNTQGESKNIVDNFASTLFTKDVLANILELMKREAENAEAELDSIASEQADLLKAHRRYEELSEKYAKLSKRLTYLSVVFGGRKNKAEIPFKVWEAAELYLGFVERARISELLIFLEWIGLTTSRQALEYAVGSHKRFRISKSGREKYVSLRR